MTDCLVVLRQVFEVGLERLLLVSDGCLVILRQVREVGLERLACWSVTDSW